MRCLPAYGASKLVIFTTSLPVVVNKTETITVTNLVSTIIPVGLNSTDDIRKTKIKRRIRKITTTTFIMDGISYSTFFITRSSKLTHKQVITRTAKTVAVTSVERKTKTITKSAFIVRTRTVVNLQKNTVTEFVTVMVATPSVVANETESITITTTETKTVNETTTATVTNRIVSKNIIFMDEISNGNNAVRRVLKKRTVFDGSVSISYNVFTTTVTSTSFTTTSIPVTVTTTLKAKTTTSPLTITTTTKRITAKFTVTLPIYTIVPMGYIETDPLKSIRTTTTIPANVLVAFTTPTISTISIDITDVTTTTTLSIPVYGDYTSTIVLSHTKYTPITSTITKKTTVTSLSVRTGIFTLPVIRVIFVF
jgi:hypothetical protein